MKKIYENPVTEVTKLDAKSVMLQTSPGGDSNHLDNEDNGDAGVKADDFLEDINWNLN